MAAPFPSLDAYLERLPGGLAAHPDLLAKGSSLRSTLADAPQPLTVGMGLPASLEELVRVPPSSTDWIREVELWALVLCVYDRSFAKSGGVAAYGTFSFNMAMRMVNSPAYRILFAILSPERLFVGAAQRWAAFHKGTVMEIVGHSRGQGAFRLRTPPHLLPEVAHVSLAEGIRAALVMAKADGATVTPRVEAPGSVLFEARWKV
jgi:hypothetical protein